MSLPAARHAYRVLRANLLHRVIRESQAQPDRWQDKGVEVVGLFATATGLGESARLCVESLTSAGIRVMVRDVSAVFRKPATVSWKAPCPAKSHRPAIRIFHLNPPMLPPAIFALGLNPFTSTYNIAYWAWELPCLPKEWQRALRYMNAVLVPSQFTRTAVSRHTSKPVHVVPHPVSEPPAVDPIRQSLGIPEEAFLATTVFNFSSSVARKNPAAAIRAFQAALGNRQDAYLVVKTAGGNTHPQEKQHLAARIGGHPRIPLIDDTWPQSQVQALLAGSSVFVSLHRSEGFGLAIAEAIRHRTPVIATTWSGNMDFCHPDEVFLVPAHMTPVGTRGGPEFRAMSGAEWAEADEGQAAKHLQAIYANPDAARERATAAARRLGDYLRHNTYLNALTAITA